MTTRQRHKIGLILVGWWLASLLPVDAATLTWSGAGASNRWGTASAYTNWTGGAGNVVWTQGADAVFDGEPGTVDGQANVNVIGGGIQFNSLTVTNIADGAMTIGKVSGNDTDFLQAVGIGTFNIPINTTLTVPRIGGSVGITITGSGTLVLSRSAIYTGPTRIVNGTLQSTTGILTSGGGDYVFLDTTGSANAKLYVRGDNTSWSLTNNIIVRSGSTGQATIENDPTSGGAGAYSPVLSGAITLSNTLNLVLSDNVTTNLTLSGNISGPGKLAFQGFGTAHQNLILSGDNSAHTGPIELITNPTNKRLIIDGTTGNANITLAGSSTLKGSGTLTYNVANDTGDLITLGTGGVFDMSGLTLQPKLSGTQTLTEYVIVATNGVTGTFASVLNYGSYDFSVDYDGTALNPGQVVLTIAVIPEPSALVLAGAGLVGLVMVMKRRRA